MSTVALIGGAGSIGTRYHCILDKLGVDVVVHDPPAGIHGNLTNCDKWIICTPTDTHYNWCLQAISAGVTFLCEKPMSKSLVETEAIVDKAYVRGVEGFVVCNYNMCSVTMKGREIYFNYFRTGKDGLCWDCCQLLYLGNQVMLKTDSFVWTLIVDGVWQVDYRDLEMSYGKMLASFCGVAGQHPSALWDLEDGHEMTRTVLQVIEKVKSEDSHIDTSAIRKH